MKTNDDILKLDKQLCFPLYAASRLTTQCYHPLLAGLGLTYPQYLVLLVLWEKDHVSLTEIAGRLLLQSNTLTPLLKRMQALKLIERKRNTTDERSIAISLTAKGAALKKKAINIPAQLGKSFPLSFAEYTQLKKLLKKIINPSLP